MIEKLAKKKAKKKKKGFGYEQTGNVSTCQIKLLGQIRLILEDISAKDGIINHTIVFVSNENEKMYN